MKTKRKFGTGTFGRIDEHADACRTFIRTQHKDPRLCGEFIGEIQGHGKEFDNRKWLRFENMEQLKAEFELWLNPK